MCQNHYPLRHVEEVSLKMLFHLEEKEFFVNRSLSFVLKK